MENNVMEKCPACSQTILKTAVVCIYCKSKVKNIPGNPGRVIPIPINPVNRFIMLSVLSLGIYHHYWFYQNWKLLKNELDPEIVPIKNTLFQLVPIYNIYLIHKCFKNLNLMFEKSGMEPIKHTEATYQYILISVYGLLPALWNLLAILNFIPLIDVQKGVNSYLALKTEKA